MDIEYENRAGHSVQSVVLKDNNIKSYDFDTTKVYNKIKGIGKIEKPHHKYSFEWEDYEDSKCYHKQVNDLNV